MTSRSFTSRARLAVSVLAAAAVAVSLSGCGIVDSIFPQQAERDDTDAVSEAGEVDAFSLLVGDCFNEDDGTSTGISAVAAVPCSEPHDSEVYYAFDIPDATYPGEDSILEQADAACEEQFDIFVGMAYADSALDYSYLYPSPDTWKTGDREVVCSVYSESPATSSLAGAAI